MLELDQRCCHSNYEVCASLIFDTKGIAVECWGSSDESGEGDAAVETEYTDSGVRLHCRRFGDELGRGSSQPVLLGELEENLLLFHFRVFRYGKTQDRTVHYSFFRVPKERVDWKPLVGDEDSG